MRLPSSGSFPFAGVLLPAVLFVLFGTVPGTGAETSAEQDRLLQQLEALAEKRSQNKEKALGQVLQQVNSAAQNGASAVSAFTDAHRAVEIAGTSAAASEFQEWRKKNSSVLNSPGFREATQLHLRYLALSLQRSNSNRPEDFVTPSMSYLETLAEAETTVFRRQDSIPNMQSQLLRTSVREGIFAKYWNLAPFFSNVENWEWSPGNFEGILEKNIRPVLREEKNQRLAETWTWQVRWEQDRFPPADTSFAAEEFRTRRLPELRMRQAADWHLLGDSLQASREGLQVLEKFPEHPAFEQWLKSIRTWIESTTSAQSAAPSEEQLTPGG